MKKTYIHQYPTMFVGHNPFSSPYKQTINSHFKHARFGEDTRLPLPGALAGRMEEGPCDPASVFEVRSHVRRHPSPDRGDSPATWEFNGN